MSTPRPRSRRPSRASEVSDRDIARGETTLTTLQRLPVLTPSRFVATTTPSANRSATRWTPRARGVAAPSTPYGLRAMQRRAANTPGRDRRRSGRQQRETTFDILRNLGKALAPISQPIRSSPQEQPTPIEEEKDEIDELDDEPDIPRPRLSLPIEDSTEDDEEYGGTPAMRPPRLSLAFDEDDITLEYSRRAKAERDRERLSMMSFGDGRPSEMFGDLTRLGSESDAAEHMVTEEVAEDTIISQGAFERGGETEDLDRFNLDFNFPSPPPPGAGDFDDEPMNDEEGFELPAMDIQPGAGEMSSDDDDATGGGFGLELNFPTRVSLSESPGVVGGGLRDEQPAPGAKQKTLSKHGIPVPNMPSGVVRKLATRFARARAGSKAKINKAALTAIEQASSCFFEQATDDLAAYSKHAGRKTIDESDVAALMRRQRHINNATTIFSLAQKHLPKELLQDMRLAMPP